MPAVKSCENVN